MIILLFTEHRRKLRTVKTVATETWDLASCDVLLVVLYIDVILMVCIKSWLHEWVKWKSGCAAIDSDSESSWGSKLCWALCRRVDVVSNVTFSNFGSRSLKKFLKAVVTIFSYGLHCSGWREFPLFFFFPCLICVQYYLSRIHNCVVRDVYCCSERWDCRTAGWSPNIITLFLNVVLSLT